jgi:LPXTG-motif cell wall-anchored protein
MWFFTFLLGMLLGKRSDKPSLGGPQPQPIYNVVPEHRQQRSGSPSWLPWVLVAFCLGALIMSIYNQSVEANDPVAQQSARPSPSPSPTSQALIEVNGSVQVARVVAPQDGWIALYRTDANGNPVYDQVLGTQRVRAGENTELDVPLDAPVGEKEQLAAVLHQDLGASGVFEYPNGPDAPLSMNGAPVAVTFTRESGALAATSSTPTATLAPVLELAPTPSVAAFPDPNATSGAPMVGATPGTGNPTAPSLGTPALDPAYPPPLGATTPTLNTAPLGEPTATATAYGEAAPFADTTPSTTITPVGQLPTSEVATPFGQQAPTFAATPPTAVAGAPTATATSGANLALDGGAATPTPTTFATVAGAATPTATSAPTVPVFGTSTPTVGTGTPAIVTSTPTIGATTASVATSTPTITPTAGAGTPAAATATPTTLGAPTTTVIMPTPTSTQAQSTGTPVGTTPTVPQPTATNLPTAGQTPTIVARNQPIVNESIVLETVVAAQDGWLVLDRIEGNAPPRFDGTAGLVYIEAGAHQNVRVPVAKSFWSGDQLVVQLHQDQGIKRTYGYPDGPDVPVEVNGDAVTASFVVQDVVAPDRLPDTGVHTRLQTWVGVAVMLLISGALLRRRQVGRRIG